MTVGKKDLDELEDRLVSKIDKKIREAKNELSDMIDDQSDQYRNLLLEFKSDFFKKIDPILKEVVTARK